MHFDNFFAHFDENDLAALFNTCTILKKHDTQILLRTVELYSTHIRHTTLISLTSTAAVLLPLFRGGASAWGVRHGGGGGAAPPGAAGDDEGGGADAARAAAAAAALGHQRPGAGGDGRGTHAIRVLKGIKK